jgi:glutaredoxin
VGRSVRVYPLKFGRALRRFSRGPPRAREIRRACLRDPDLHRGRSGRDRVPLARFGFARPRDTRCDAPGRSPSGRRDRGEARRIGSGEVEAPVETKAGSREPSPSKFYQWVDERGSVHFAASLDEIPSEWRSRAGQVELESAAFTRTASTAPKPERRRPVVEVAAARRAHDVTVYTAPWCGWCRKTLAFLDERGVDYVNKDIESDPRHADELREKTGGNAIPLVEIDGNPIRGFDPQQMAALLD